MGYFILKKGKDDQFYFTLYAGNNRAILQSEGYKSKSSAENGIESTRTNASFSSRFHQKRSLDDKLYFVLKAANGQVIGTSEMYETMNALEKGIDSVMRNAPQAKVEDNTEA